MKETIKKPLKACKVWIKMLKFAQIQFINNIVLTP